MYIEQETSSSNNVYFIYKQYISINNSSNILFKKAFKQDYHSTNFPIPNFDFIILILEYYFELYIENQVQYKWAVKRVEVLLPLKDGNQL